MDIHGPPNVFIRLKPQTIPVKRRHSKSDTTETIKRKKRHSSVSESSDEDESDQDIHWSCHTQILYNESPYFASLFGESFCDSKSNTTYLPAGIIDSTAFNNIVQYMYTQEIEQTESLQELCDMYSAADYLGMDQLCSLLTKRMTEFVHNCTCYCQTCVTSVPYLFPFCRTRTVELQDERMAAMTQKSIMILTGDPEKALPSYWITRHMAQLLIQLPQEISQALSQKVLHRVNKYNAIESLHACFAASSILSTSDPLLSWSKPLHATLTSVQSRATRTIARHFDFFCCQYPALLSCIDGITYSFDFLEYLLLHVLEDQMDSDNVGILYKGIVYDLMSRHAVQYNDQARHILNVAKVMILQYITRMIGDIKKHGGLDNLHEDMLKQLADDLDVRPKTLVHSKHPLFHRGIFSFLIPSIPNLTITSSSTHTNGLSRYSSHSTTHTARRVSIPRRSLSHTTTRTFSSSNSATFISHLAKLFKKFSDKSTSPTQSLSESRASQTLPAPTANTEVSTTSWSQIKVSQIKISQIKRRESGLFSFAKMKRKRSMKGQVSAPMIGMHRRVQLTRRPAPTVGTVMFVGHVSFAEGVWVGVELDRRVGKNDGSVDGIRYFTCSPNRGVFVRPEDVSIVV
ncbi:hypothetical protein EDC96DRAFT_487712 [Choanephora cucurbitarum]|nr:hypothetical protein EDC96DRAFT_487712 [Choanephora cucurbitarum]